MAIEHNFPSEKEARNFEKTFFEKEKGDDFDAVLEIIKDNPLDPHLKMNINKLSADDFGLAKKFKNENLTEEEISEYIENLEKRGTKPGNPHYDFAASLKNKIVEKEAWKKREGKKKEGGFA